MRDEDINMAIAEECGWENVHKPGFPGLVLGAPPKGWELKRDPFPNYYGNYYEIPNFVADLNTMHKAEAMLLEGVNWEGYHNGLRDMIFPVWHATARQRAEAFLRTISKWKE